jgi:predicted helicase
LGINRLPWIDLSLGSPGVHVLDPCKVSGNFIVNLLGRIPKCGPPRMYREQLFANEVMLLPCCIAALNIEHFSYSAIRKATTPFRTFGTFPTPSH